MNTSEWAAQGRELLATCEEGRFADETYVYHSAPYASSGKERFAIIAGQQIVYLKAKTLAQSFTLWKTRKIPWTIDWVVNRGDITESRAFTTRVSMKLRKPIEKANGEIVKTVTIACTSSDGPKLQAALASSLIPLNTMPSVKLPGPAPLPPNLAASHQPSSHDLKVWFEKQAEEHRKAGNMVDYCQSLAQAKQLESQELKACGREVEARKSLAQATKLLSINLKAYGDDNAAREALAEANEYFEQETSNKRQLHAAVKQDAKGAVPLSEAEELMRQLEVLNDSVPAVPAATNDAQIKDLKRRAVMKKKEGALDEARALLQRAKALEQQQAKGAASGTAPAPGGPGSTPNRPPDEAEDLLAEFEQLHAEIHGHETQKHKKTEASAIAQAGGADAESCGELRAQAQQLQKQARGLHLQGKHAEARELQKQAKQLEAQADAPGQDSNSHAQNAGVVPLSEEKELVMQLGPNDGTAVATKVATKAATNEALIKDLERRAVQKKREGSIAEARVLLEQVI
jgi:hypothetical protein